MSFLKSKKKKILSGIGVDTIGSFIAQLIGIITIPFYLTFITPDIYGAWLALNGFIMMAVIFDLPMEQYIVTNGVGIFFLKQSFNDELSKILGIKVLTSLFFIIFSFAAWWLVPYVLNSSNHSLISQVQPLVFFLVLSVILNSFISIFYGILTSQSEFAIVNLMTTISLIFQSILPLVLMHFGFKIKAFFYSTLLISAISLIFSFTIVFSKYKHLSFRPKFEKINLKEEMLSYTLSFQAIRWLTLFRTQFVLVILNKLLGGNAAAIYNMTSRLPLTLSGYSAKISLPFLPIFSELFLLDEEKSLISTFKRVTKLLTRIGIGLLIIGIAFNSSFVALWVGKSLVSEKKAEIIILFSMFFNILISCFGIVVFASKQFGKWVVFAVFEIACVLASSIALKGHGLTGVLLAFFIGFTLTNLYLYRYVLKLLHIKSSDFLKEILVPGLIPNLPLLISVLLARYFFHVDTWKDLIVNGVFVLFFGIISYEIFTFFRARKT